MKILSTYAHDPLQNILYCFNEVLFCRSQQKPGEWGALLGELDHVTEIYGTLEAVKEDRWPRTMSFTS